MDPPEWLILILEIQIEFFFFSTGQAPPGPLPPADVPGTQSAQQYSQYYQQYQEYQYYQSWSAYSQYYNQFSYPYGGGYTTDHFQVSMIFFF